MSPRRPGAVLLAGWLLAGVAAAHAAAATGAFFAVPEIGWAYAERAGDDAASRLPVTGAVLLGTGSLLIAVAFAGLAVAVGRGPAASRAFVWAAAVVAVAGGVPFLVVFGYDAVPWYRRLTVTVAWLTMALPAVAAVLLASPAARRSARIPIQIDGTLFIGR